MTRRTYDECDGPGCDSRWTVAEPYVTREEMPPGWFFTFAQPPTGFGVSREPRIFCSPACVVRFSDEEASA